MLNLQNGIPLREFHGDKQDLSLVSLTKYLKGMRDVKDVRVKISEDFLSVKPGKSPRASNNNFKIATQRSARRAS